MKRARDKEKTSSRLLCPRNEAAEKLAARINEGSVLCQRSIIDIAGLEALSRDYYTWSEYNEELLARDMYRCPYNQAL